MKEEKTKPLTEKEVLAAYGASSLETVHAILLSGKFAPAPAIPVAKEEKLIGEATLFEKAVYTARDNAREEHNALVESYEKMLFNQRTTGIKEELNNTRVILSQLKNLHDILDKLFWLSIEKRLSALGIECNGIGIREGYQIIKREMSEKNIASLLAGLSLSAMSGMEEEHRCDTCPGYDFCDLPQKKPRKSGMDAVAGHA